MIYKEFTCENCRKKFSAVPSTNRLYCSRKCSHNRNDSERLSITDKRRNYDVVTYYALPGLMNDVKIKFKPTSSEKMLDDIMEAVSNETKITVEQIIGSDRKRPVVKARHLFFYLAKKYSGCSLSTIANTCDRDHTTVMHGVRATTEYIKNEDDLKQTLRKIEMTLV